MSSGTDRQSLEQSRESLKNTSIFSTDHKTLSVFSANNDKESDREEEQFEKCISEEDIKTARYRRKLFRDAVVQEDTAHCSTASAFQPAPQDAALELHEADGKTASEAIASHKKPYRNQFLNHNLEDDHTIDAEVSTSTRL